MHVAYMYVCRQLWTVMSKAVALCTNNKPTETEITAKVASHTTTQTVFCLFA